MTAIKHFLGPQTARYDNSVRSTLFSDLTLLEIVLRYIFAVFLLLAVIFCDIKVTVLKARHAEQNSRYPITA